MTWGVWVWVEPKLDPKLTPKVGTPEPPGGSSQGVGVGGRVQTPQVQNKNQTLLCAAVACQWQLYSEGSLNMPPSGCSVQVCGDAAVPMVSCASQVHKFTSATPFLPP